MSGWSVEAQNREIVSIYIVVAGKLMDPFGARFKREREKRKISLDDVSAATKISNRFLSAIESDRFDQLPGGIFNRGFIRAYARHLDLDEEQLITDYKVAAGEEDPNVPLETDLPEDRRSQTGHGGSELPWKELAALLLLIAVALGLWRFRSHEEARKSVGSALKEALPRDASTAPPPSATADKNAHQVISTSLSKSAAPHPINPNSQPFQLRIIAREDSWISVTGPEGEILHQVLTPPEEKSFHSTSRIVVKAGNAAGLEFVWNGHELPAQGKEGEVKTFIFDSGGVHEPLAVPAP
jgi:cytoskeleton protein RodZ